MGHRYQAVQWNGNKVVYDLYVVLALAIFIGVFLVVGSQPHPSGNVADPVVLMIRGLGVSAFSLLTIILMIGPLARLSPRFLPLLYNRRHLGVITFLVAGAHFGLATLWYHGGGPLNPLVSLFVSNHAWDQIPGIPFELFGLAAFVVLAVMAATSHDFWLNNLSAPVWKALHMLVYPAYGVLVLHIVLGALMTQKALLYPVLTALAFSVVTILHGVAGVREWRRDNLLKAHDQDDWMIVGAPDDIAEKRAIIVPLARGDRVAVFKYDGKVSAVQNACRHQNGPLGEGRVIDGCITCPWHGWQYRPHDGISPPPFTEKIATYDVRYENGMILLKTTPNPPGTPSPPAYLDDHPQAEGLSTALGGAP
ncbi:MAG: Rieske 2Fe-2S domain-containing protein [Pseudomonadota bacterium]